MTLVYDTLMWRDEHGTPQPWLASSVATSADGRRVSLQLRPGIRWQDGAPLNAGDVAFTFHYVALHPHYRFSDEVRQVESVQVGADPAKLVINLRRPEAGFVDQTLADLPILPSHVWQRLPTSAVAPEGLPVGSGPYRLVEHVPGRSYRFEANSGYFRGPPAVQVIEVPIIDDAERTLTAFEHRELDMVPVTLRRDDEARLTQLGNRILRGPSYLGSAVMLNVHRPPFDDAQVRAAASLALDLDQLAGDLGNSVAARRGYLHPDSPWAPHMDLQRFDEAASHRALGRLTLPPVEVLVPDNDDLKLELGKRVAQALTRAGLRATAQPLARAELSRAVGEDGSRPTFSAAIWGIQPLASDDPDFLRRVFGSDPSQAIFDYPGYGSAAFDAAAQRVSTTLDPAARHIAVTDELRILASDAPVIPLVFPIGTFAFRPGVYEGWVFVKGTGPLDKLSFVEPHSPPAAGAGTARERPQAEIAGPSLLPLWIALGVVGVAVLGGGIEMRRRR